MPPALDPAVVALLEAARAEFARSLPGKAADLAALVAAGSWEEARRAAHKLRGSSGTHGFAALSAAAADVEDTLIEAKGLPGEAARARIDARLAEARAEAARAAEAAG
jgi:HPt (histidine-containing phosphotransfer) domain-containing protein